MRIQYCTQCQRLKGAVLAVRLCKPPANVAIAEAEEALGKHRRDVHHFDELECRTGNPLQSEMLRENYRLTLAELYYFNSSITEDRRRALLKKLSEGEQALDEHHQHCGCPETSATEGSGAV